MPRMTIKKMADKLGISTASVSYALNDRPGVSVQTRERVRRLADDLNWRPSASALSLLTARAEAVGMILNRSTSVLGNEPYYMHVLQGIEDELSRANMSLVLRMTNGAPADDLEIYRRWSAEGKVDGVILFDSTVDDLRCRVLDSLEMPYVLHGVRAGRTNRTAEQNADATLIIRHLAAIGHQQVLHLAGPLVYTHEMDRQRAVALAAEQMGIGVRTINGDYSADFAQRTIAEECDAGFPETAIIASNDLTALGTLNALQGAEQFATALVSWDDSLICRFSRPSITALSRHPEEVGRRTAQLLLRLTADSAPVSDEIPPSDLIVRDTSVDRRRM